MEYEAKEKSRASPATRGDPLRTNSIRSTTRLGRSTANLRFVVALLLTFMDGGNLGPKGREKGHMDKCAVTFMDDDHFTSRWTWYQDGKESWMEEILHERVKAGDAQGVAAPPAPAPVAPVNAAPEPHSHH